MIRSSATNPGGCSNSGESYCENDDELYTPTENALFSSADQRGPNFLENSRAYIKDILNLDFLVFPEECQNCKEAKSQMERLESSLQTQSAQLIEANAANLELKNKLEKLQDQLEKGKGKIAELSSEVDTVRNEKEKLKAKLTKITSNGHRGNASHIFLAPAPPHPLCRQQQRSPQLVSSSSDVNPSCTSVEAAPKRTRNYHGLNISQYRQNGTTMCMCGVIYESLQPLIEHLHDLSSTYNEPFLCSLCRKHIRRWVHFKKHLKIKHNLTVDE